MLNLRLKIKKKKDNETLSVKRTKRNVTNHAENAEHFLNKKN